MKINDNFHTLSIFLQGPELRRKLASQLRISCGQHLYGAEMMLNAELQRRERF